MESDLARIRGPYKKPKGFSQLTFPETPEAIAAKKLVLGILVPD